MIVPHDDDFMDDAIQIEEIQQRQMHTVLEKKLN